VVPCGGLDDWQVHDPLHGHTLPLPFRQVQRPQSAATLFALRRIELEFVAALHVLFAALTHCRNSGFALNNFKRLWSPPLACYHGVVVEAEDIGGLAGWYGAAVVEPEAPIMPSSTVATQPSRSPIHASYHLSDTGESWLLIQTSGVTQQSSSARCKSTVQPLSC